MHSQHAFTPEEPRPEFIPFTVPRLGPAYDVSGFEDYPARSGWVVHRYDPCCCEGGRCPPGRCVLKGDQYDHDGLALPALSKTTDTETTCSEKVAFLQSWLFFGALAEAHTACNLAINTEDYVADTFNTGQLNGLPLRLYQTSERSGCGGSETLRKKNYTPSFDRANL